MEAYADEPDLVILGAEQGGSRLENVLAWIDRYGWTFPVGFNRSDLLNLFSSTYDAFFVIDRDGIVRYRRVGENTRGSTFPEFKAAIDQALATPAPVRVMTWGRVKQLYGPSS